MERNQLSMALQAAQEPQAITIAIARLETKPGDVVVLQFPKGYPAEYLQRAQLIMTEALPPGVNAVVLPADAQVSVVSAEALAEAKAEAAHAS